VVFLSPYHRQRVTPPSGQYRKLFTYFFSTKQNKRRLTDKEFTFSVSDGEVRGANKGSVE